MASLSVEYVPAKEMVPYALNSRTHSDEQVQQIAASIKEFGFTNPILIDEDGGIIAGHGRLMAANLLKIKEVPTITLAGLTEAQKKAYIIADNQLALNAGWNLDNLKVEVERLLEMDFEIDLLGFEEGFINGLLHDAPAGLTDENDVPEKPEDPISRLGDVWLLGKHRLVCGDCTDPLIVDKCLDGITPHLMVTDPPYGVEYDPKWRAEVGVNKNKGKMGEVKNDDKSDWRDAWSLFPGDVAYIWHAGRYASAVQHSLEVSNFDIRCQIIWVKDRFALSRGDYHWQHEPCWYAVRKSATGHWAGDRKQSTTWNIKAREDGGLGHSTQKPVECMRRPIENNSSPGQAIYEPFSGSGTTIIAAEQTGRICHAIEINPAYVDIAVKRWEDYTGNRASHIDGTPFESAA